MVTHSYYEEDPRVRREAEALVARGRPVEVFALRRPEDDPSGEVAGVRVHRLDVQRHQGAGLPTYLAEYLAFFGRAGWALTRRHRHRRFAVVQVHSLPDFLVFAALPLRLAGVPVILDLHEAMPEFFRTRFAGAANPVTHRLLLVQERLSIAAADVVFSVNHARHERLLGLGVPPSKAHVVMNGPRLDRFDPSRHPRRPFMADGTLRLAYAGAITPLYELDLVLAAMDRLRTERPALRVRFDLFGRGDAEDELRSLAAELGLADAVTFHGRIELDAIPAALAGADVAVSPIRQTPFTEISLSTKVFEAAAMEKAVLAARMPTALHYFPEAILPYYAPGDPVDFATALLRLVDFPAERERMIGAAAERARELSWDREADAYAAIVEGLARDGLSSRPATQRRSQEGS